MIIALSDKVLMPWLEGKEYLDCSDEAEAVGIAAGWYLSTGKTATVAISADGAFNILNFLTSWIVPEKIPVHLVISVGRTEMQHFIATDQIPNVIESTVVYYGATHISFEFVRK